MDDTQRQEHRLIEQGYPAGLSGRYSQDKQGDSLHSMAPRESGSQSVNCTNPIRKKSRPGSQDFVSSLKAPFQALFLS